MLIAMLFGCQEQSYDKGESISNINLFEVYEEEEHNQTGEIDLTLITESECTNPCSFEAKAGRLIEYVEYYAKEYYLGHSYDSSHNFPMTYHFQETGLREIEVLGFDSDYRLINWDTQNVNVRPEGAQDREIELVFGQRCENPCTFRVSAPHNVTRVDYYVDSWWIGSSQNPDSDFSLTYEFDLVGERHLTMIGLNNQNVVAQGSAYIEVEEAEVGTPDVPYFYQYSNALYPSSSCQNTAIAMLLAHYGWPGVPDDITASWGKNFAQEPHNLAYLFNTIASENGIEKRLYATTNGTLDELRAELDAGNPTIIHGYFTSYGHVMIVLGYDENGYWVNDSAGKWNQYFMGGYPYGWNSTIGKGIYYNKAYFEEAIATWNGYSPAPLWFHKIR